MTDLPSPPPPPWAALPAPPPPPPPPPRRRHGILAVAVVALVVVIAGVAVVVLGGGNDYPDEWDARVTELVAFVERERGHRFEHPVPIDFLTEEEYTEQTRTDDAELSDEDRESIEAAEGLLRAVGLVAGDIDLFESSNDLNDTGTLAYYDSETERVTVRGTEVTPPIAVTLVHELTHVLQDQVFGLDLLEDTDATSGQQAAFRALVEGDAGRIEDRYVEQLDDADAAAVTESEEGDLAALEGEEIPVALQAFFAMPYALGEGFVAVLEASSDDAIDDAFRDPPTSEEHLLDPFSFLDDDQPALVVTPDVGDAEVLDDGDFGAASLFLVLAERIDLTQALAAATGWGGDAYVTYRDGDRSCLELDVVGDEATDADELEAALTAWVAAGPADAASVSRESSRVRLHACDPGLEAAGGNGASLDALGFAATRTYVAAGALDQGADEDQARCYAEGILREFTLEELNAEDTPADFEARLGEVAAACL